MKLMWGLLFLIFVAAAKADRVSIVPVPKELRSSRFTVTIGGRRADFLNAAANYYDLNFDLQGRTEIVITALTADYWARGVEVQPWRENIRPSRNGATIRFTLDHAAKLSISRPGDHLAGAEMLFIFANEPERHVPTARSHGVRIYGPGVHRGGIDARTGDRIYLASGAVILGGLNVWDVEDVKVWGRGTILYDGPQNPKDDEGWMNKKDWHGIVMHNARKIEISGITCIVRSRTWMIQMKDSRFIVFDNVKVIGGGAGNANQDGMDWLGGGDTVVRNSFIRAADDIFAMYGNWEGYTADVISIPGHEVSNILIEKSVLSTSISNVVRVGWPKKVFSSHGFSMRDSDVIHMGSGGCGIPFALLELWGMPDAKGTHEDYLFEDVRLEDWYSLMQLQQVSPAVRNVRFRNIWAPEAPAMVGSTVIGDVNEVSFERVKMGDRTSANAEGLEVTASEGAAMPRIDGGVGQVHAAFTYHTSKKTEDREVSFDASGSSALLDEVKAASPAGVKTYDWFFGDGTTAHGRVISHTFADAEGTLLDGSGRYRVMLRVTGEAGDTDWAARGVVVPRVMMPAADATSVEPGLRYTTYEGKWSGVPRFEDESPVDRGIVAGVTKVRHQSATNFGFSLEGYLRVPESGGYTFSVRSRDGSKLVIDGTPVAKSAAPWPQVCGSVGNAVQSASGSVGLAQGLHSIRLEVTQTAGEDGMDLLWEGPGISTSRVPEAMFTHATRLD